MIEYVYTQTQCADPWQTSTLDQDEYARLIVDYLDRNHGISAMITNMDQNAEGNVCQACVCQRSGGWVITVGLDNDEDELMEMLGFRKG